MKFPQNIPVEPIVRTFTVSKYSVINRGILFLLAGCLGGFGWISGALAVDQAQTQATTGGLEFIQVSKDGSHFAFAGSHSKFTPWGFNYDRDFSGRLLETYWLKEWDAVVRHFGEMKALGANTVRIHLQVSRFMKSEREPNRESLDQLARLVTLAEKTGLYLDVTGLGCYDKKDVPQWYNDLGEAQRWDVQARFWEAVAGTCRKSPAVFCYDLMNEPVVAEDKKDRDWTPGALGDKYYVQRLTLDFKGRTAEQVAKAWVNKMTGAIRKHDRRHLLTVGEIPWALTWPGAKSIFGSKEVGKNLDFVSVHFYPKADEVDKALTALAVYHIGKPLVIEEMFPLSCSVAEMNQFIEGSRSLAAGWITFYWGKTIDEYKKENSGGVDATTLHWLEYFVKKTPEILGRDARQKNTERDR